MEKKHVGWAYGLGSDSSYDREHAKRLNEAADELNHLNRERLTTERQVLRLLELDRDQQQAIAKLQTVVYVLMQMLSERGALDGKELESRIQSEFARLEVDPEWKRMRGA